MLKNGFVRFKKHLLGFCSTVSCQLKIKTIFRITVLQISVLILTSSFVFAKDRGTLRITNKLGVDATVELDIIHWLDTGIVEINHVRSYMFSSYLIGRRDSKFVLSVDEGMYLAIPMHVFRSAKLVGGKHIVTLSNGQKLKGELIGIVKGEGKEYNLRQAKKVVWAKAPTEWHTASQKSSDLWQLTTSTAALFVTSRTPGTKQ